MRDLKAELDTAKGDAAPAEPQERAPATGESKPTEPEPATPDAPAIPGPNTLLRGRRTARDVNIDIFGSRSGWLQPRLVQACERLKKVSASVSSCARCVTTSRR